jgi:hypothetical protein
MQKVTVPIRGNLKTSTLKSRDEQPIRPLNCRGSLQALIDHGRVDPVAIRGISRAFW